MQDCWMRKYLAAEKTPVLARVELNTGGLDSILHATLTPRIPGQ